MRFSNAGPKAKLRHRFPRAHYLPQTGLIKGRNCRHTRQGHYQNNLELPSPSVMTSPTATPQTCQIIKVGLAGDDRRDNHEHQRMETKSTGGGNETNEWRVGVEITALFSFRRQLLPRFPLEYYKDQGLKLPAEGNGRTLFVLYTPIPGQAFGYTWTQAPSVAWLVVSMGATYLTFTGNGTVGV